MLTFHGAYSELSVVTNSEDMLHEPFQLRPGSINGPENLDFPQKLTKTLVELSVALIDNALRYGLRGLAGDE